MYIYIYIHTCICIHTHIDVHYEMCIYIYICICMHMCYLTVQNLTLQKTLENPLFVLFKGFRWFSGDEGSGTSGKLCVWDACYVRKETCLQLSVLYMCDTYGCVIYYVHMYLSRSLSLSIYMYIYIYIYISYVVYIYIYIERERDTHTNN